MSKEKLLRDISYLIHDPFAINLLSNSEDLELLQVIAVTLNSEVIKAIDNPSSKVQVAAVNNNVNSINHIKNPSGEVRALTVSRRQRELYHQS